MARSHHREQSAAKADTPSTSQLKPALLEVFEAWQSSPSCFKGFFYTDERVLPPQESIPWAQSPTAPLRAPEVTHPSNTPRYITRARNKNPPPHTHIPHHHHHPQLSRRRSLLPSSQDLASTTKFPAQFFPVAQFTLPGLLASQARSTLLPTPQIPQITCLAQIQFCL